MTRHTSVVVEHVWRGWKTMRTCGSNGTSRAAVSHRVNRAAQNVTALLFCSTGVILGCVWIWCSCRFSIFSVLSVELDWLAATSGGCTRGGDFSLVPDPIICAPWSVLFGKGQHCDLCSQDKQLRAFFFDCCVVTNYETRATFRRKSEYGERTAELLLDR